MAKLILTNEVAGLGSAGDVVEVKNGYARNYLIPQGFAVAWTRGGEKQVASIRAARESRAIHDHEEAVALKNALEAQQGQPGRQGRRRGPSVRLGQDRARRRRRQGRWPGRPRQAQDPHHLADQVGGRARGYGSSARRPDRRDHAFGGRRQVTSRRHDGCRSPALSRGFRSAASVFSVSRCETGRARRPARLRVTRPGAARPRHRRRR